MRLGTLVPHFGQFATPELILEGARRAERAGIRSFWARDHLIWKPHGMEGSDRTFLSPFVTLAGVAAVTTGCRLGTAVAIPVRSPLKLAQNYLSLAALNAGSVIAGIGLGFDDQEFAAVGFDAGHKEQILVETVSVLRQAFAGEAVTVDGEVFHFDEVELAREMASHIPIVYGGDSPRAVRRSLRLADGWLPSRIPMEALRERLAYRDSLIEAEGSGRRPALIVQPLTVIAPSSSEAARCVPLGQLAASVSGSRHWPEGARSAEPTIGSLRGVIVCGAPDEVVEQILEFDELGADEYVFDCRLQFDHYFDILDLLADEVVPKVTARAAAAEV